MRKWLAAWLTGLLVFGVYLFTLAPGMVPIDAGELAAVQATLGIAHPTGYPLFTVVGHVFLLLPLPHTKIYRANMLSAIWCSLGIVVFILLINLLFQHVFSESLNLSSKPKKFKRNAPLQQWILVCSSIVGGLILAFSLTYWLQSTSVEVYSLHAFLLLLAIYSLLKAWIFQQHEKECLHVSNSSWYAVAVVFAAGFTNHMSMIFLLPGAAMLYFSSTNPLRKSIVHHMGMVLLFIFLVSAMYVYVPLRANQHPPLCWGAPDNMIALVQHIMGDQYYHAMFVSPDIALVNGLKFLKILPIQFGYGPFIFLLIGVFALFRRSRMIFFFLMCNILVNFILAINYNIRDIFPYYLLAYISCGICIATGIAATIGAFHHTLFQRITAMIFVSFILVIEIALNSRVSHHRLHTYDDYITAVLRSTDQEAVVFTSKNTADWDIITSPALYYQKVEGLRADITILNTGLLGMPWYSIQMEQHHPTIFRGMNMQLTNFQHRFNLLKNEKSDLQTRMYLAEYQVMLDSLVQVNVRLHPVYFSPEFYRYEYLQGGIRLPAGYGVVPDFLLFKVVTDTIRYHRLSVPDISIRLPKYRNQYIQTLEYFAGEVWTARAYEYEKKFNHYEETERFAELIKNNLPDYSYQFRGQ